MTKDKTIKTHTFFLVFTKIPAFFLKATVFAILAIAVLSSTAWPQDFFPLAVGNGQIEKVHHSEWNATEYFNTVITKDSVNDNGNRIYAFSQSSDTTTIMATHSGFSTQYLEKGDTVWYNGHSNKFPVGLHSITDGQILSAYMPHSSPPYFDTTFYSYIGDYTIDIGTFHGCYLSKTLTKNLINSQWVTVDTNFTIRAPNVGIIAGHNLKNGFLVSSQVIRFRINDVEYTSAIDKTPLRLLPSPNIGIAVKPLSPHAFLFRVAPATPPLPSTLIVYDLAGKKISQLALSKDKTAIWEPPSISGPYLVTGRLQSGNHVTSRFIVVH